MKHTKLPWDIIFNDEYSVNIVACKDKISEEIICQNLHKINAKFIVRAVNSHDELLEAAEIALKHLDQGSYKNDELVMEVLKKAIAKAKGK